MNCSTRNRANRSRANRKGQSIVEATVAVSVLAVGFLGILTLLARSLFLSRVTSDGFTATYLAAEGIEIVKNLIDHDLYSGGPWPWGRCGGACTTDDTYIADYTTGTGVAQSQPLIPHPCDESPNLHFDPATRRYSYSDSAPTTNFKRCIQITHIGQYHVTVNSTVSWSTGPVTSQSINLEDHFYYWRP